MCGNILSRNNMVKVTSHTILALWQFQTYGWQFQRLPIHMTNNPLGWIVLALQVFNTNGECHNAHMKLVFLALCFTQMSLHLNQKLGWISSFHNSTTFLVSNYLLNLNIFLLCFTSYLINSSSPYRFCNHKSNF